MEHGYGSLYVILLQQTAHTCSLAYSDTLLEPDISATFLVPLYIKTASGGSAVESTCQNAGTVLGVRKIPEEGGHPLQYSSPKSLGQRAWRLHSLEGESGTTAAQLTKYPKHVVSSVVYVLLGPRLELPVFISGDHGISLLFLLSAF